MTEFDFNIPDECDERWTDGPLQNIVIARKGLTTVFAGDEVIFTDHTTVTGAENDYADMIASSGGSWLERDEAP